MEGPSLVIATEELSFFKKQKVQNGKLKGQALIDVQSWGKHLLLTFTEVKLRIHFLMFGSYRIDVPRENRTPKLELRFKTGTVFFYSCAIKEVDEFQYDWSIDLMSRAWDPKKAMKALKNQKEKMICDVLMDQTVFSGLGNIMKNEVLFRLRHHPETKVGALSSGQQKRLVEEAREYSFQFYEWKKKNVLKRNWLIFRKKKCPACGKKVTKRPTGSLKRLSHYCTHCQKKISAC